jgi:hypothetical protein
METAIYSTLGLLFVSILSGLAYLAVKHPLTFNAFGKYILMGLFVIIVYAAGFGFGAAHGIGKVRHLIRPEAVGETYSIAMWVHLNAVLVGFGCAAIGGFLWILAKIGAHIYENEKGREDEKEGERK